MKTALVIYFNGQEDIESFTIVDILRRADVKVTTASVHDKTVTTAFEQRAEANTLVADLPNFDYDAIIIPGGAGCIGSLSVEAAQSNPAVARLHEAIKAALNKTTIIAAICAGPVVLSQIGVLKGADYTCYPTCKDMIVNAEARAYHDDAAVVRFDRIITSRGPATSVAFGIALADALVGTEAAQQIADGMLYQGTTHTI